MTEQKKQTEKSMNIVEDDMRTRRYREDADYIEKIFAVFPLLGSAVLSPAKLDSLNSTCKDHLRYLLNSDMRPDRMAEMRITLAIINYAKGWDSGDESGFWKYITAQFGYRENNRLRNMLCDCVRSALDWNHKWFITNSGGNQYKSSIVVHAFSPKRSWLYFIDFLFDFYKTNLNWEYIENDPMIARMVDALRNKLRDAGDTGDGDIRISSKIYNFREGIVKLLLYRPGYAVKLVSSLLKRIDALLSHTAPPAARYEEQLCDEWFANKLQGHPVIGRTDFWEVKKAVAIDYTRINPVYRLYNEADIQIVFPDVRIAENDFSSLKLMIYHDGHIVEQKGLSSYGNELGRSMSGFTWNLEDYLHRSASDQFDPRFVIRCDSKEIYDSVKVLYRRCLVFRNKTEVDITNCEQGGYSIFVPKMVSVEFKGAEVSPIKENDYLKGCYVELKKDFVIYLDGEPVAFDKSQSSDGLRIIEPRTGAAAYAANGMRYSIVTGSEKIAIVLSRTYAAKGYQLRINSELKRMDLLPHEDSENTRFYQIGIGNQGADEVSVRLVDLANNRLMFRRDYKVIPAFDYKFSRPFYFSSEDFAEAWLRVETGNNAEEFPVIAGDSHIKVPYLNGELDIPVPIVQVTDNVGIEWNGTNIYWIGDIPQERFLYVRAPEGLDTKISIQGRPVAKESSNAFALGNAVCGYSAPSDCGWLEVTLSVAHERESKEYVLGKIAAKEQFAEKPVLKLQDRKPTWDLGHGFIGDTTSAFKISLYTSTEYEMSFDLKLDQETIAEELELPLGIYRYTISKQSGNLFAPRFLTVASGDFFVGDVNELRFLRQRIRIDSITIEDDKSVPICPCYIDHIVYRGIRYVASEGRECPVYNGILFYIRDGKRREYSRVYREDGRGNSIYPVNPVRIVFINDSVLCITNETGDPEDPGDGFYYYSYKNKNTGEIIYQITDREPVAKRNPITGKMEQPRYYSLVDLYSYKREGEEYHV